MKITSTHDIVSYLTQSPYSRKLIRNFNFGSKKKRTAFLAYHSVSKFRKGRRSYYFTVKLKNFRSQIKFLHENGYHGISLSEWYRILSHKETVPERTIVLTFDDGFADNFYYVCPVLKKYNFTATFYLIWRFIKSRKKFPWLNEPIFPLRENLPLEPEHVLQMDRENMEIGSHTLTHDKLNRLSNQRSWKEIKMSKLNLEDLIGHDIATFSYPYGSWLDFSSLHKNMVEKAGYKSAVTSIYGGNSYKSNYFALRRIPVYETDDLETFDMKVNGYFSWVEKLQWLLSHFNKYIRLQNTRF